MGRMAKRIQPIRRTMDPSESVKSLNVGQATNKNMTKNMTANLVQAISQTSNFFIFLLNFSITYLTPFIQHNKIIPLLI